MYEDIRGGGVPCQPHVLRRIRYADRVVANEAQEDKRPASRRVADELLALIDSGALRPGDPLPTYRKLAGDYGVAVNTAMAAVRHLQKSGAVTIRPHAGARVSDRSEAVDVAAELNQARSELGELREQVQHVSTELAELEQRLSALADRLGKPAE
nr:winged helix-turn-helix domain-containing protein [Saccharopolyspora hordei]